MARVTEFFRATTASAPHPTEVECGYQTVLRPGIRLLQLSTYGSSDRMSEKKVSQTIQLDVAAAASLSHILADFLATA